MIDNKLGSDVDTVVVGAGQAGLAAGMALRQGRTELRDRRRRRSARRVLDPLLGQPHTLLTVPVRLASRAAVARKARPLPDAGRGDPLPP
jgi:flavin-dependent dehydrogenase